MTNGRMIIVGPSAAGKTFLRNRMESRGIKCDVSYTSREPRDGEVDGVDYRFIGKKQFQILIMGDFFYEWAEYNGEYYGTGLKEWNEYPLFIMETAGIKKISETDRKNCFIIYLSPPLEIRMKRLKERGWDKKKINQRLETDKKKFSNFTDYDIMITNPYF